MSASSGSPRTEAVFSVRWNAWSLAALALTALVLAVPYLSNHSFVVLAFALQRGFALVCHQRPERCFWILGAPVAVCARCLGIYVGAAIGLVVRTSHAIAMRLLIAAAVINALDAATEFAGLHGNWMVVRFALGLMLGMAGALLISSSISREDLAPAEAGSRLAESSKTLA
jgi:uncharacterized membrane protein